MELTAAAYGRSSLVRSSMPPIVQVQKRVGAVVALGSEIGSASDGADLEAHGESGMIRPPVPLIT